MRSRLTFILLVAAMATIGLAIALTAHRVDSLGVQLEESKSDRASLKADLNDQEAASQALAEQVKRLGGKPVVDPVQAPPSTSPNQPSPGLTPAQIVAGVDAWCSIGNRCKPPGLTRQQVLAAVAAHCAGGNCQGPPPRDGKDAPAITAAQISAGIAAHCANDACSIKGDKGDEGDQGEKGEKGDTGEKGEKGEPGSVTPGVYTCPDGEWVSALSVAEDGSLALTCSPLIGRR